MTKAEIKNLIIKSDYKNKDVVIWWKYNDITSVAIYNDNDDGFYLDYNDIAYELDDLVDVIFWVSSNCNLKLKILEVDNV